MPSSQFSVDVNATLNTDNIPKQLQTLNAKLTKTTSSMVKIPVGFDVETGKKVFGNFIKDVRKYTDEIGNSFKRITITDPFSGLVKSDNITQVTDSIKTLTTETHKWTNSKGEIQNWTTSIDGAGQTIQTRTKQYINDTNELVTETSKWGRNAQGQWAQLSDTIKTTTDIIKESTTSTSSVVGQIDDLDKSYQGLITTTEKVGSNGEYLRTVVSQYTNEMGQAVVKTEQFNKVGQQVATTMRKIGDAKKGSVETGKTTLIDASGNKTITQYADGVATLRTEVNQYKTALGGLVTVTSTYNAQTNELISKNREVTTNLQEQTKELEKEKQLKQQLTTTTREHEQIIQREGESYKAVVKTIQEETHDMGTLTTTITTYKNKLGETVVETQKLDSNGKAVAQTTRTIIKELDNAGNNANKASNGVKNLGDSAERANYGVKNLGWSLSDAFSRLANFYLASLPIRALQNGISNAVETVKEFDSAITEMGKVTDYSGETLQKYTKDLGELGKEVARTRTEMTEAATGWLKAGYSEEDAAKLAKYSSLLQNTADEELSAAEATSILVSQLKAYHMEADEAIKVTDIINAVSAQQAVSSYDISQGLTVASASMATFGNSIEQATALLTAGTTIFQGRSSQVARGLNMIATRISKNEDALADYGVAIYDTAGNLRSTYDILVDLAPKWEQMSKAEQVALGNTLAGTNQYKILAAVLSQMDVAQEAYKQALDSTGETMKQNAVYMESLEARTTALKAEWENFVLGNGGLQDCAKVFVSIATNVVKLINNLGGLPPVLTTITGLLIGINALKIASTITNLFTSIQNGLQNIIYAIPNAISAWKAYAANVVTANTAMQASAPLIGLVATALGLVVSGIMVHNRKLEEQKKAIKENIAAFSEEYKALEDVSEKLKNENITREELDNIISSNLDSYEAERLKLLDNNEARKEAINLIEEEKKARAQELVDTGLSTYEESLENLEKGYDEFDKWFYTRRESYSKGILEKAGVADAKTASEQIKSLKNLRLLLIEARSEAIKRGEDRDSLGVKNITKEIGELEGLISSLNESFEKDTEIINNYNDSLETLGKYYKTSTKEIVNGSKKSYIAIEEERKGREKLSYANKKSVQELDELQKKYNITEQAIYDYIDANQEENITREDAIEALALEAEAQIKSGEALGDLDKRYEDLLSSSKDVVSSISKVSSALQEQSKNGSLAVETQLELIEAGYGAALMYDKETGACKLDEKAVQALVEAKLEMQIANLQIARSDIVSKLMAEANAAVVSAGAFLELAKAKNLANQAVLDYSGKSGGRSAADPSKSTSGYGGNFGYLAIDAEKATNQIDTLNNEIDALKSSLKGIKTSGVGTFDGVKSGAKSAKNATDDLNKSLEETKKKYDTVIKWISKQYDKEIDNIKKAEKEALKAEEAKIKAKEKEKDKALDAIEAEINALEKAKDARKKYWDDQIDALKKANDARKDALELQEKLDALEKAKATKVKIYKEGQGFVYDVDQTAVAEAQKELDEYLSEKAYEDELARLEALRDAEIDNYEQRIDAMNEYKDNVQANYEAQIEALNEHKEQLQEQYEAEIEMYENYKQQFEDMVNAYEEEQNRLLAQQLTGIDFENKNWMTRLDNLQKFVNEYNKLQKQIGGDNTNVSADKSFSGGGSLPSSSGRSSGNALKSSGSTKVGYVPTSVTKAISKQTGQKDTSGRVYLHSSGADSIKDDEIAIVGENPNKEIVIGSKINNGQLMSLDKGTGVVNAESSKTLASMLNQVGQFGSSGFGSGNGTLNSNINNDTLTINGVTIQGSNIKDPETFVNGLLNLKAEALQRAYKHR